VLPVGKDWGCLKDKRLDWDHYPMFLGSYHHQRKNSERKQSKEMSRSFNTNKIHTQGISLGFSKETHCLWFRIASYGEMLMDYWWVKAGKRWCSRYGRKLSDKMVLTSSE
jgi:hypothetical protein